jgi:hypothetical protein
MLGVFIRDKGETSYMRRVYHAIGLNMHQPLGNLLALHDSNEQWEAKQILWCDDRPTRMLEGYEDAARLHMSFSGTLLKQLEDPAARETCHDVADIEALLDRCRKSYIEFVGTGLYHPSIPSRRMITGTPKPTGGSVWASTCWALTGFRGSGRLRWVSAWK